MAHICDKVTGRRTAALALLLTGLGTLTGVAATGKTAAFPLDLREGDRLSAGSEELTFSNLWDGDAEATVTIAQDGAAIFTGLSGEGVKTWSVDRNGRYELTHTTYTNGVKGKVETAVFVVEGKEVPVSELTIDWGQKSFVYDGQPKEPVITVKDGATTLTKDVHYLVEYKDNINVGTAKAIVKGIEPYVEDVTNTFTITKATIGPGGGGSDEPGSGEIPEGGLSRFDATYMYDGEGHTIKTNELVEAFRATVGDDFTVSYTVGESGGPGGPALPWLSVSPVFTNVGEAVVWYKVTSANYEDFVHEAKVTIMPKPLAVTADAKTQVYGEAAKPLTYTTDGLISGDTLSGALTREPGENVGEYDILQGTLANGNYTINYTGAKYTITKTTIGPGGGGSDEPGAGEVPEGGVSKFDAVAMYDGEGHTIKTNELVEAFRAAVGNDFTVSYTVGECGGSGGPALPWLSVSPVFTNVGEAVVWYKVTSANYEDFVHAAKVAITRRPVTVTSPTKSKEYDGTALTFGADEVAVAADGEAGSAGLVEGESFVFANFAEQVEEGETDATFDILPGAGTLLENYVLTVVTGKLTVVLTVKPVVFPPAVRTKTYNGEMQVAEIAASDRYTVVRNNGGKMAGTYPVVLKLTDAAHTRWFGTDDDTVVLTFEITAAENAWLEGPTAPTQLLDAAATFPVAAAKYGDVEVRYSGTAADGAVVSDVLQVVKPGEYTASFRVRGTSSWCGFTTLVPVTVSASGAVVAGEAETVPDRPPSAAAVIKVGGKTIAIPQAWFDRYPGFVAKFGSDYAAAALMPTGKRGADGQALAVWQEYVLGTDPTDPDSKFTVAIGFADGRPVITWSPDLNADGVVRRVYTVWGKKEISDPDWTAHADTLPGVWRFFRVSVETLAE